MFFFLDECVVPTISINGNAIVQFISELLTQYNLNYNNFDAVVVDGASYNFTAHDILKEKNPDLLLIWCVCHM